MHSENIAKLMLSIWNPLKTAFKMNIYWESTVGTRNKGYNNKLEIVHFLRVTEILLNKRTRSNTNFYDSDSQ